MPSNRITERDGCTLIFGTVPLAKLAAITKRASAGAVLDTDLARMAGAAMAFGPPDACDALKATLAGKLKQDTARQHPGLSDAASAWLAAGERGMSSDAIFHQLTGINTGAQLDHPSDPADLRRCRLLLEAVPEFATRFKAVMATVSPHWAALVEAWDSLCETMDGEAPDWRKGKWTCALTYRQMHDLRDSAA